MNKINYESIKKKINYEKGKCPHLLNYLALMVLNLKCTITFNTVLILVKDLKIIYFLYLNNKILYLPLSYLIFSYSPKYAKITF